MQIHERGKAFDGVNFYSSRKQGKAWLVDMEGRPLHQWKGVKTGSWQHVTLLPDGDVLALVKNQSVIRVDKDSKVEWSHPARCTTTCRVEPDGSVYVLAARPTADEQLGPEVVALEDYVAVLSPAGELVLEIPLLGPIAASPTRTCSSGPARPGPPAVPGHAERGPEVRPLHTNHVEVLDGSLAQVTPAFERQHPVLPRNLHTIIVIDPRTLAIEWAWGAGELVFPHHPDGDRCRNVARVRQRLLERLADPRDRPGTGAIVWTYGPEPASSPTPRSNQRLPNGNTLITESDTGYVFKVTPGAESRLGSS